MYAKVPWPTSALFLAFALLSGLTARAQGQAVLGDTVPDLAFATFDENGQLVGSSLADFENKVLILYYYAPW